MTVFYLLLMGLSVALFLYFKREPKLTVACPKCGSTNNTEIGVEQVNMDYYERGSGGFGGTEIMVKADEEHTFHCNKCSTTFKKTITRSR